jgi:hypothetical protein
VSDLIQLDVRFDYGVYAIALFQAHPPWELAEDPLLLVAEYVDQVPRKL